MEYCVCMSNDMQIAVRLITTSLSVNITINSLFFYLYLCSPRQTKSIPCLLMPCLLASPGHQGLYYWELKRCNQSVSATHDIVAMAYYLFYPKGIFDAKINIVVADDQVPLMVYTWSVIMICVNSYIKQNITQYESSTMSWCKMITKWTVSLGVSQENRYFAHIC